MAKKIKIVFDPLRAVGNMIFAVGIVTSIITLLPGSDFSGNILWATFGAIFIGLGANLKATITTVIKEEKEENKIPITL